MAATDDDGPSTRDRILRSVRACVAHQGYARTTAKEVARQAGVTTGAVYHYFPSKEALFLAAVEESGRHVATALRTAVAAEPSEHVVDKLAALLSRAVELNLEDPDLAAFVSTAAIEFRRRQIPPVSLNGERTTRSVIEELISQAATGGEMAPDVPPPAVVDILLTTIYGLALLACVLDEPALHRRTILACARLIDGTLLAG